MDLRGFPFRRGRTDAPSRGGVVPEALAPQPQALDARYLFDLLPAYVTVQDRSFRIVQGNETFRNDFGDVIGQTCFAVYKGREDICPGCPLVRTVEDGRRSSWEETLRTAQQEPIHTIVHAAPIRDTEGEIVGALTVSSDIGELKHLQRQLEMSQQEYKALFNWVPCYISIQDRDLKIIKTNRTFEQDFGRAIGRRCYEVYKGRDERCPNCPVERTLQDGEVHSSEEIVRLQTGDEAQMIVYTTPLYDLSGQIFAVMEMATNITQVKRLQRELATLGRAVAVTSHAIKNILNGLKGGAYVVQSGLKRSDPALAQQGWEMVQEGVDMVGELVKDILLISKERVPEYQETNPNEPAEQVWTLFREKAADLGIQLSLEPEVDAAQTKLLDPKGVHTVLANLVSNAIDACGMVEETGGKRVLIRVKDLGPEGILYEVADNGSGIPASIKEKLFREIVSTKGSSGTGLGLVTASKIVKEHGGTITVDSDPKRGTTVRASFPGTPMSPPEAAGKTVHRTDQPGLRAGLHP